MREYKVIETAENEIRPRDKANTIRPVSAKKLKEREKLLPDPAKLEDGEIPDGILKKIDKMVLDKMREITPDFL
jgi:hypothetical protein